MSCLQMPNIQPIEQSKEKTYLPLSTHPKLDITTTIPSKTEVSYKSKYDGTIRYASLAEDFVLNLPANTKITMGSDTFELLNNKIDNVKVTMINQSDITQSNINIDMINLWITLKKDTKIIKKSSGLMHIIKEDLDVNLPLNCPIVLEHGSIVKSKLFTFTVDNTLNDKPLKGCLLDIN